jgi:hypothetical protein
MKHSASIACVLSSINNCLNLKLASLGSPAPDDIGDDDDDNDDDDYLYKIATWQWILKSTLYMLYIKLYGPMTKGHKKTEIIKHIYDTLKYLHMYSR